MEEKNATQSYNARTISIGLSCVLALSVLLPQPGTDGRIAHLPTVCPFYWITGLPCPGCGLTRAFVCLGHGQFRDSLHWHPIGWLVYAVAIGYWLFTTIAWLTNCPTPVLPKKLYHAIPWTTLILVLGVGFTRIVWLTLHHQKFGV